MTSRRVVLIVVGLLVTAAAVIFAVVGWTRLPAAAAAVSALAAVVGVGVAAWAALGGSRKHAAPRSVEVRDSGDIRGTTTTAVSGVAIMGGPPPEQATIDRSGGIDGGETGVSGYHQSTDTS